MATYKTSELFNKLAQMINDGYEYVDISESDGDDEMPAILYFEAIVNDFARYNYESIDSHILPEDYDVEAPISRTVNASDFCSGMVFTYKEIFALNHAVNNALEYFKECSKDPANKELLSEIKSASVDCRNLQAKFAKFLKRFRTDAS